MASLLRYCPDFTTNVPWQMGSDLIFFFFFFGGGGGAFMGSVSRVFLS